MWDGVANLTYKLCGRYPFVYHANEIRMHLPETYRNFYVGADTLLGMGMTADQSRIYSRFSMADADGTYGKFQELVEGGKAAEVTWDDDTIYLKLQQTSQKTLFSAVSLRPAAGSCVSAEICRTGIDFLLFRPHRSSGSRSGRPDHLLRRY